jgi:hypothetical protein
VTWEALATIDTFQSHRNFTNNGFPKHLLPSRHSVENLVRLGCLSI